MTNELQSKFKLEKKTHLVNIYKESKTLAILLHQ